MRPRAKTGEDVLTVERLTLRLRGAPTPVVDDVSFRIRAGRTTALLGDSGTGKTVTALSLLGLLPRAWDVPTGRVRLHGATSGALDILNLPERRWRGIRGRRIAMVFQDPAAALNPVMRIGTQVAEGLLVHRLLGRRASRRQAAALLERVGIPDSGRNVDAYPHELSGGMQQRVVIAMALACGPQVVIADEPTSALDVTVQAQVLQLLADLQAEQGLGLLMITHDMGVVAQVADELCVMQDGRIVEYGTVEELFANPRHHATRKLIAGIPRLEESEP